MAILFEKSVISPVFVGRAEYLIFFEHVFEQLGSGQPHFVLVSGEAGIGKSRLVAEAKARLATERVRCLQGACLEQDRTLPLAPFVDALRRLLPGPERDEYLVQLLPFAPELIKILPDLTLWLSEVRPTTALEPEQEKRRLFTALSAFLLGLSKQRPIVLILEDVHWCDEVSLEFLLFLSHQLGTHPLLLVLTYRDTEVSASLRRLLAALNRERAAVEVALVPLSKEETHALVRAIFQMQRPVQRPYLEMLYSLTEGNPFFVEEVLKTLLASGDIFFRDGMWDRKPLDVLHVPRSIADAVQQRLGVLSEAAREMLALAAAMGRQVEFSLLQALTQWPPDGLLSLIETTIAAQLLVETADGQLAFRHALTQQAVYTSLLVPRRKALHLRIAQTIEHQGALAIEDHLADLAFHFYQASAWSQALEYGQRSGEKALALYSPQAAVEHFTHSLEAAAHLPDGQFHHLYRLRGQVHEHLGNFEAAQRDFEQALSAARAVQDPETEWYILMAITFLWTERDYPRAEDYLRRALELAQALGDTQKFAFTQNLRGYWLTNAGQPVASIPLHEEALAASLRCSEVQCIGSTLQYLALALLYSGDMQRADVCNDQAIAFARTWGDKRSLANCLVMGIALATPVLNETTYSTREPLAKRRQDIQKALAQADSIEWQTGQVLIHYNASLACSSAGLLGQGLAHARLGLAGAEEMENAQLMAACCYALGLAHLLLLEPLEALALLERALALARPAGSVFWIGMIAATLAQVYLLQGDLASAETMLAQAFSHESTPRNIQERYLLRIWGELALARHHPERALHLADALIASAPGEPQDYPIPSLWKLRGEALHALGQVEEALHVLEEAAAEAQVQGALPLLWHIQRSLGLTYLAAKQRLAARQTFAAAHETIACLAASLDDEQQRARFWQAALAMLPKQPPLTPRQEAKGTFGGLSAREREVALLIAQGKTNREIAAALDISRSTTATHIGHIYNRLGISTRVQLAAWVVDQRAAQPYHAETHER
jgi:predicted ATPase/DNA-binding CsgD family transcriptional regulator